MKEYQAIFQDPEGTDIYGDTRSSLGAALNTTLAKDVEAQMVGVQVREVGNYTAVPLSEILTARGARA